MLIPESGHTSHAGAPPGFTDVTLPTKATQQGPDTSVMDAMQTGDSQRPGCPPCPPTEPGADP